MNCVVHGVAKSRTRLSNFHFQFYTSLIGQEKERRHLFLSGNIQSESFIPQRHPNTSFFFGQGHGNLLVLCRILWSHGGQS